MSGQALLAEGRPLENMIVISPLAASETRAGVEVLGDSGRLSQGVAHSVVRYFWFTLPFALGALLWDVASTSTELVSGLLWLPNNEEEGIGKRLSRSTVKWARAGRAFALAGHAFAVMALSVLYALADGDAQLRCDVWPKIVIMLASLSLCSATACFASRAMTAPSLAVPRITMTVLVVAWIVQLAVSMSALSAWAGLSQLGGQQPGACSLVVQRWSGLL
ncbi:hypothetical protein CBOM_07336 [Ceraceosorus bombacis]|uniref:Uncharacterized protein n=1 Tax=Ceraceosorus bombacis TaxID=401625 RepID=A0A0P1B8C8_9BASI|nr:hypothetical protein CBOM_07336 [Ceraceosorus bombacis]